MSLRINLGCGDDVRQGYVNVDFRQTHPSVMRVDLSRPPWPFQASSADEILMLDFLEHFPYRDTDRILGEVARILSPGGTVDIQVPDFVQLSDALQWRGTFYCNSCGFWINTIKDSKCLSCGRRREIQDAAVGRLYGGQDYTGNFHQTCFTETRLMELASEHSLELRQVLEQKHQTLNWNFCHRYQKR